MHKENSQSDFTKTVEDIRVAEEKAEKIKEEAKLYSEQAIKRAKDNVIKMSKETEDEVVKLKNAKLQNGKQKIDEEVHIIIENAQKDSEKFRKSKFSEPESKSIIKKFIDSL